MQATTFKAAKYSKRFYVPAVVFHLLHFTVSESFPRFLEALYSTWIDWLTKGSGEIYLRKSNLLLQFYEFLRIVSVIFLPLIWEQKRKIALKSPGGNNKTFHLILLAVVLFIHVVDDRRMCIALRLVIIRNIRLFKEGFEVAHSRCTTYFICNRKRWIRLESSWKVLALVIM